jgi:carbon-monoxide dehydrogenase medium subunit
LHSTDQTFYKTHVLLREVGYARPDTLDEAVALLAADPEARALAGGQTLINVMKARAGSPDALIDLSAIDELKGIELGTEGVLEIGAMTTYSELMASSEARARPILGEVCAQIADVQVRNRGTIGGNVCTNDPTNHLPPLLAAVGASFVIRGREGSRTVSAADFFLGVYLTAVGPGELLTTVRVPAGRNDGFAAVTLGVDGTCIASAAASLDGHVRVALGCVDAVPVVLEPAATDPESVRGAVRGATFDPPSDVHASSAYRRHLAEVLAVRAVSEAERR